MKLLVTAFLCGYWMCVPNCRAEFPAIPDARSGDTQLISPPRSGDTRSGDTQLISPLVSRYKLCVTRSHADVYNDSPNMAKFSPILPVPSVPPGMIATPHVVSIPCAIEILPDCAELKALLDGKICISVPAIGTSHTSGDPTLIVWDNPFPSDPKKGKGVYNATQDQVTHNLSHPSCQDISCVSPDLGELRRI